MPDIKRTAGEVQVAVQGILRKRSVRSTTLLQGDVVDRMRVRVSRQEAQAGRKTLLSGHLQGMVARESIGGCITVARYPRRDGIQEFTRSHGARSRDRLINVVRGVQMAAHIAEIGSLQNNVVGQLTLHTEIELLSVRILVIG